VQSDYTMRGSNFKGVLVLLDGMPLNDPQTGHYLSDLPVPLDAIARVEVLRGPASAMYGPDAVGGVVQLFTHAGLKQAQEQGWISDASSAPGWQGSGHARYGDHAFYDAGGSARLDGGDTFVSAATRWQGTDGEIIRTEGGAPVEQVNSSAPLRTDFTRQAHTAALHQSLGDNTSLYTRAGVDLRDFNAYHFYTDFDSDRARSNNRTYWLQSRLQGTLGGEAGGSRTPWQVQAAAKQHEGLYVYNPMFPSSRDYSRKLDLQAQASRTLAAGLTATAGASGQLRGVESQSLGNHQDARTGAFAAAQWQVTDRFTVNASSRLDYDTVFGLQATPQASVAYTWPALTLRAAAGRSVRAPTYTELYLDTQVEKTDGNLGNPDLQSERSWSYEAGLDVRPLPGLSLHATAFYRDTENFIDYAALPSDVSPTGDTLFVARNILRVQTPGVEADVEWRQSVGGAQLSLTGTYTRLAPALKGTDPSVTYKYALTSARHLVQGALRVRRDLGGGRLSVGLRGLWKDRRDRPSYGVVHGRVRYALPVLDNRLGLTAEVRNILDVDYAEIFDAPMPGRWWIVGASFDL
jgi:outer membrane cobalamin receptor